MLVLAILRRRSIAAAAGHPIYVPDGANEKVIQIERRHVSDQALRLAAVARRPDLCRAARIDVA